MATGEDHLRERERRLNEVIAAYLEAVEGGENADRQSWLDRYPEFADDLKELFAAQEKFAPLRPRRGGVQEEVCPHCHNRIEVVDEPPADVTCPLCGRHFHLISAQAGGHETVKKQPQDASSRELQIRCPHCHNPVEIGPDTPFSDIVCSSCGSHFSLVDDKGVFAAPTVGRIGHFDTLEHLGIGAFGSVWKARDTELDRTVALKIPRKGQLTAAETEQFLREARAAAQLRHPNIVTVHEVGRDGETVYIVSDLIRGVSLSDWLIGQRLTGREAAELCARIADGLHHAHQAGVIHRDLKPSNIMIDADGEPRIMDFGLAKREVGEITMTLDGQALGTPAYMSPEQAKGESHRSDRRSDVYSLGVILFELLTGELPFRGNRQMLLHQAIHEEPPSPRRLNRNIARDMETICLKCLEKEPHKRYSTAKELAEELRRFLRGEPIEARPIGKVARMWRRCKRYPVASGLAAALVLVLLGGFAGVTSQWIRADRQADIASQQRDIASQQRDDAERNLYHSLVREARAIRLARVSGYRREVWDRLKQALALDTPVKDLDELRQEAVGCMGDFVGLQPTAWEPGASGLRQLVIRPQTGELAIGLHCGYVLLRELPGGAETARLLGHGGGIAALSFNLAGNILLSADDQGNIRVWEANRSGDWTCTRKLVVPGAGIGALAITPDGKRLFVCHGSGSKVTSFSFTGGTIETEVNELPEPDAPVKGTAFTRDGRLLARGQEVDGVWEFLLWDVAKRETLKIVNPGLSESANVIFSADGSLMICACAGGVGVYNLAEDRLVTFLRGSFVNQVAVSSDNRVLAASCSFLSVVKLWSILRHEELGVVQHPDMRWAEHAAISGDGSVLVAGRAGGLFLWDLTGGDERLAPSGHTLSVRGLAFNSDGTMLASAGSDGTVKIWNPVTGRLLSQLSGFRGLPRTLAFNPDASLLAVGLSFGDVEIWSPHTGERLAVADRNLGIELWCLDFSADGQYLAAGGEKGGRIWRVSVETAPNGKAPRVSLKEHAQATHHFTKSMCFSPNSKLLAWVNSGDWRPRVWDLEANKQLWMVPSKTVQPAFAISFYPDSQLLTFVSADRSIEAWNVTTGQRVSQFAGSAHSRIPEGQNLHITALSSDGRLFAWASGARVTVWDTRQKRFLFELPEERGAIWDLDFSPDGQRLAVSTDAGGPVIWNIPKIRSQLAELGLDW